MAGGSLHSLVRHIRQLVHGPRSVAESDRELLERFAATQDEAAFAILVQRHGPMVFNVCRRVLHDDHGADDAFQATFLVLIRKAGSVGNPDLLANWLYGVAYRVALRARGRAAQRHAREKEVADMPDIAGPAGENWQELRPLLDAELDRLPEKYRAPLVLCYLEGKTNEEAALLLNWPKGTIQGRLARGREQLRQRLERRGITLSVGALFGILADHALSAGLPQTLIHATLAMQETVKQSAVVAVSAEVSLLAEGVIRAMLVTKLKMAAAVMLVLVMAGSTGVYTLGALVEKDGDDRRKNAPEPTATEKAKIKTVPDSKPAEPKKEPTTDPSGSQEDPADPRIQQLIAMLDSDFFVERENATKKLQAMGLAALPALRKTAAGATSMEVKRRAEKIIEAISVKNPGAQNISDKEMASAWQQLADAEPGKVLPPQQTLASAKNWAAFLKENLKAEKAMDFSKVESHIKNLANEGFDTREQASSELLKLGPPATPVLRDCLKNKKLIADPEVKKRVKEVLEKIEASPTMRQGVRGLEVLALIGTKEAKEMLESFAKQEPKTWLSDPAAKLLKSAEKQ